MSDDPVMVALENLEAAITEYWNVSDEPGVMLGAVLVVERRVENRGAPGASTDCIQLMTPFVGQTSHARALGLLHWGREWLMHGPGDRSDGA